MITPIGGRSKFVAWFPTDAAPKVNAPAVVTGPWTVRYDPAPADVDTIGIFDVQIEVTRSNGKKITLPTVDPGEAGSLTWRIGTDLDNA